MPLRTVVYLDYGNTSIIELKKTEMELEQNTVITVMVTVQIYFFIFLLQVIYIDELVKQNLYRN
jgi:hypothetical protein